VTAISLESREEMPASSWEVEDAEHEGVQFEHRWGVKQILSQGGEVRGVELRAVARVFDEQRRFAPTYHDDQLTTREADVVILAIGQKTNMTFLTPEDGIAVTPRGLVQVDPDTGQLLRAIALQYNPDSLTRTLQVQASGTESGQRSQALRLRGPAIETIKLEAEIDATDVLDDPDAHPDAVALGVHPQLAVLETLVHPRTDALQQNDALAASGVLEILPLQAPLTLFVWSKQRVVPVRVTDVSVTEEAFDVALNPIRAKVSLGLRVLSVDDLGFRARGGTLFMSYLRTKEALARRAGSVSLSTLGIESV
jgi:hypothetical protein